MISRTLVPKNILPAAPGEAEKPRRSSTFLDSRQLVPCELPVVPLDASSRIPDHVPLDVLRARVLVPRDSGGPPLQTKSALPQHLPLTVLDSRVVVPRNAQPATLEIKSGFRPDALGVLEPDVLTTGKVNLLARPVEEETGWHLKSNWQSSVSSIVFHGALIVLLLLQPQLFPFRPPTQEQMELASRSLGMIYVPPSAPALKRMPAPVTPPDTSPQIRIDPRVFREMAPEAEPKPTPGQPEPPRVTRELPDAPKPQSPPGSFVEPLRQPEPRQRPPLETVKPSDSQRSALTLPNLSPGRSLDDTLRGVARDGRSSDSVGFGGRLPPGGGGSGEAYGALTLLTPTEGVDFTNYLQRVLARVRYNWYAVIPESARMGEKGKVILQFRILRDGSVPAAEPSLVRTSGRDPLDFAAVSSIRSSNPFEPLPAAFSGPFIELRFIFLYNLPIDAP